MLLPDEILLTMRRNAGVAVSAAGAGGEAGKRGSYYNSSSGAAARAAGTSRDPFLSAQADEKVSTRAALYMSISFLPFVTSDGHIYLGAN
jgi:hypothetical protein